MHGSSLVVRIGGGMECCECVPDVEVRRPFRERIYLTPFSDQALLQEIRELPRPYSRNSTQPQSVLRCRRFRYIRTCRCMLRQRLFCLAPALARHTKESRRRHQQNAPFGIQRRRVDKSVLCRPENFHPVIGGHCILPSYSPSPQSDCTH